jgi:cell volume regulation protein A
VEEVTTFGAVILVVALAFSLAILANRITDYLPLPAPALFLLAAALASDISDRLANALSIRDVERIGVVALILILFDGGIHVGWRRFRESAYPIASLGILGTFATAGVMAVAAQLVLDVDWTTAGIIGAALAPTDPAVMFSVLGKREVAGRTGTILEGESGANDPVGIALMIGLLDYATSDDGTLWMVPGEFVLEMAVGLAVGIAGAAALIWLIRHVTLPSAALYPLRTLAAAGVIYGVAAVLHGSGFLAVFIAGLLVSDVEAPFKLEIERFHTSLASLAEIAVFVALGLTIDLGSIVTSRVLVEGIVLAVVLGLLARPLAVAVLLLPARLRWGERAFVAWGGLKGAVPILLAALAFLAPVDEADRIYKLVFVVVTVSVVVQGTLLPFAASLARVPMRERPIVPQLSE